MGLYENLSTDEVRLLKQDPRQWAANFLSHPDDPERPYDFKDTTGSTKLNYLLHDDGPLNPSRWGNVNIIKFCRGGLKTTLTTLLNAWAITMYPNVGIYMTAPRQGQVREFAERLDDKIRQAGVKNRREVKTDNISRKVFELPIEKDDGGERIYKAKFQADSGWGEGDALRGPHSHIGVIDEFQDITRSSFETFMPAIDRELPDADWAPVVFIIGTPKEAGSFYEEMWRKSDQREWDEESLTWHVRDERAEFKPSDDLLDEMGMEDEDIDGYEVAGWHLDAYNSPLHTAQQIARDKANFAPRKFTNEVEAQFYSPEDDLLSREVLNAHFFDSEQSFARSRQSEDTFVGMGVDWGGGADKNAGLTVVSVVEFERREDGHSDGTILTIDPLPSDTTPAEELDEVEDRLNRYGVDMAVVDHGHGSKQMMDLQDGTGPIDPRGYQESVVGAKFGNVRNKDDITYESDSGQRRFFTCDKTYQVERFVEYVRQGKLTCPSGSLSFDATDAKGATIVDHMTAPYKDYVQTTDKSTKKVRVQTNDNQNDDVFDSLLYALLAYKEVDATTTVSTVATSSRF
jgi:hypothetical protein